jgi:hypothetical protein
MARNRRLAVLIGDIVGSKKRKDRLHLQRTVQDVLIRANEVLGPVQPLEFAVGDEFQGGFADVASAIEASLWLRLALLVQPEGIDSRYGLGHGAVTVFDRLRTPISQDGPAWWSARAAIDRAKTLADSPRTSFARTCFGYWPDDKNPSNANAAVVESFLFCRDSIVDHMNGRQRRLLWGLLLGRTQAQLATDEGITQGAVSQSLHRSGAFAVEAAQQRLCARVP